LQGAYAVGPLAASQSTLLIVDPLASITLGIELFHEQLNTGAVYILGAAASLAVLGAGVVMLSIWAPPVMTAEAIARLPGHGRPGEEDVQHALNATTGRGAVRPRARPGRRSRTRAS
jgi:hypothetical protein